jgi:hypothetical protein
MSQTTINDLPLDCLRLIAITDLKAYKAMLAVKRFALQTLGSNNVHMRSHFITCIHKHDATDNYNYTEYRLNGKLHQDNDLPAIVCDNGVQIWYKYGNRHRDNDLPAYTTIRGHQEWYQNDKCHRENDKPAIISNDGNRYWYRNGRLHRDGGLPNIIWSNGSEASI